MTDCVVCDGLGCEFCGKVGFERRLKELLAARQSFVEGHKVYACEPCECGGICDNCDPGDCACGRGSA